MKHKVRIVVKGYVQEYGVDFDELFAPVTRLEIVRLLLALSAKKCSKIHHMDVKSAILNGELYEDVYVSQSEGFKRKGQEHLVYKLRKALYGVRQAPRAWHLKLSKTLEGMGLVRYPYEHAVYTMHAGSEIHIIAIYANEKIGRLFDISDLGLLSYYLGIVVKQGQGFVELKQTTYAKKILEKTGMGECNQTKYRMDPKVQITSDQGGTPLDATSYKSIVGSPRYIVHTRPDIAYDVGIVSRFMEKPTVMHLNAAKCILRYVKGHGVLD